MCIDKGGWVSVDWRKGMCVGGGGREWGGVLMKGEGPESCRPS